MASIGKRAAATQSSESGFRLKSKEKGVRYMDDANYSYDNHFSDSDDILSDPGGLPDPGLADFSRVKRVGSSLYSIPRQAGQCDIVNREPKDEGGQQCGASGSSRIRQENAGLWDILAYPGPVPTTSSYGALAGAGVPTEYEYLSTGDPDAPQNHSEQAQRGAAMLHADYGHYAPRPPYAIRQHIQNLKKPSSSTRTAAQRGMTTPGTSTASSPGRGDAWGDCYAVNAEEKTLDDVPSPRNGRLATT
ncbi:hypothetical protein DL769_002390 [Monosporascus sp. CRB-8-3]|nr:hypothetical protein DL769_002390 [Monosporascus sp. CRB-8-3]